MSLNINTIIQTKTLMYSTNADYTILNTDYRIILTAGGSALRYLTLPLVATSQGMCVIIKRTYAGGFDYSVRPTTGERLEDVVNGTFLIDTQYECVEIHCVSGTWIIVNSYP